MSIKIYRFSIKVYVVIYPEGIKRHSIFEFAILIFVFYNKQYQ